MSEAASSPLLGNFEDAGRTFFVDHTDFMCYLGTRGGLLCIVGERDSQADTQREAEDDEDNDQRADPLQLPATARMVDTFVDFLISFLQVDDCIVGLMLGRLHRFFLLDDQSVEVFK